jgi:hypothetical protein
MLKQQRKNFMRSKTLQQFTIHYNDLFSVPNYFKTKSFTKLSKDIIV